MILLNISIDNYKICHNMNTLFNLSKSDFKCWHIVLLASVCVKIKPDIFMQFETVSCRH